MGSTSLTTNANGALLVETRYKPCPLRFPAGVLREGEVRYVTPSSTLPTRYTFTGQYSQVADEVTDLGTGGFGLLFYNARWYDPALGRFAQADSLIPGAGDPQAWDRYAYVKNSPLNYNDPSGHRPDNGCETEGCTSGGGGSGEGGSGRDRRSGGRGGPALDDLVQHGNPAQPMQASDGPIVIKLPNNVTIVIMPAGYSPSPYYRTMEQLALAQYLTEWGVGLDELELAAVLAPFDTVVFDYILSAADVGVTGGSCVNSGECYYGQPHPELQNMLVLNQDALLTTSDLVAPVLGGILAAAPTGGLGFVPGSQIVDAITTSMSMVYDTTRWTGSTPNYESVGIDTSLNLNIIFYR